MSKPNTTLSNRALVLNLVLCLLTAGGWLLPFGIYILMMWSQKRKPSLLVAGMHTVLSLFTSLIWLALIVIYYVAKKK